MLCTASAAMNVIISGMQASTFLLLVLADIFFSSAALLDFAWENWM